MSHAYIKICLHIRSECPISACCFFNDILTLISSCCHNRFKHEFTALDCIFKVIMLATKQTQCFAVNTCLNRVC